MKILRQVMCLFFILVLQLSCSTPAENAKQELSAKGIIVTADALIDQAKEGNTSNVTLLLEAGVPADSPGENGSSPLAVAASSGQIAVIDILLGAGADTDQSDLNGDTPLIRAVKMGQLQAAVKLIESGADSATINNLGESALSIAVNNKNWPMVTALGKAGVNLDLRDKYGRTRLYNLIENGDGDSDLAEALIYGGANVNIADDAGLTPFAVAVNHNQVKLVELMIQNGADINEVLHNNQSYSPLMQAIEKEYAELASVLIDSGADVNFTVSETGDSCLYRAVYNQQKDIVEMLIKADADVNTHNIFFDSPLARASVHTNEKNLEIAEILVEAGADLDAIVTRDGRTPLHLAVRKDDNLRDSLQFLLDKGAATNIYDNEGHTPLTLAVQNNNLAAVNALIEAGVDVDFPAMNGKTPLFLAKESNFYKIASKLRSAGAARNE